MVAGALLFPVLPSPIALEKKPVEPVIAGVAMTAGKKDASDHEVGPWPLLATLVEIHGGTIVALDREHPTADELSALLQDRTTTEQTTFDPRLMAEIRKLAGYHQDAGPPRIEIVSGYRSPRLNEELRKKGHRVASHSQHSLGHAIDFRIVGMTAKQMHDELEALKWQGGIGQYDGAHDQFVHMDVGRNRRWFER